jgi:hypothetical protein
MYDDEILEKYTRCSCGTYHVTHQSLNRLIESTLDEKNFQSMCNDLNGSLCKNPI